MSDTTFMSENVKACADFVGDNPHLQMLKLMEEAGEVAAAYIGWQGNSRPGKEAGRDDVVRELADVALAAMVALENMGADSVFTVAARAAGVKARAIEQRRIDQLTRENLDRSWKAATQPPRREQEETNHERNPDTARGLRRKYEVRKLNYSQRWVVEGESAEGQNGHFEPHVTYSDPGPCFVLRYPTDRHAAVALAAYADSCAAEFPQLAADLRAQLGSPEAELGTHDYSPTEASENRCGLCGMYADDPDHAKV